MIKLENIIKGGEFKRMISCERNVKELDSLLNTIKSEVEYQPNRDQYDSAPPVFYTRWHEDCSYDELFKNIMAIKTPEEKEIVPVEKPRVSKTLNN